MTDCNESVAEMPEGAPSNFHIIRDATSLTHTAE